MLSYQHAFHAGNHADILKHYVLTFVLNSLNKKDKPYTFFDSHSGCGLYDLLDNRSLKTGEAERGIKNFYEYCQTQDISILGDSFRLYLDFVSKKLKNNFYPGSPAIEKHFIREQDFLILSELHPREVENLKNYILTTNCKNIKIHHRNGFEMVNALTPPDTKRGGVLIDPSYEEVKDYQDVEKCVISINKKWSTGIILLWYPLLAYRESLIEGMINNISSAARKVNPNTEILDIRLCVNDKNSHKETSLKNVLSDEAKKNPPRLYGSGMLVINAPWHLKEESDVFCDFSNSFFQQKN